MKDKIFEIENYGSLNRAVEELCAYLLASAVSPDRVFDSKLVAYELLANVSKHTESSATFSGWIEDGFVRLKIVSRHAFCPAEKGRCPDVFAENGRGWFLVDSVCQERWLEQDGALIVKIRIQ